MAKVYGTKVKTGRVGASVFSVSRGVTIERQYQPMVNNPSTTMQVEQRAKFKLASQLAAALAPELSPYGRQKNVSARNAFIKDLFNRGAVGYSDQVASINRGLIRLTSSRVAMIVGATAQASAEGITITGTIPAEYRGRIMGIRIVAISPRVISREDLDIAVVAATTVLPDDRTFSATLTYGRTYSSNVVIYAFVPESEAAITRYESLVASGTDEVVTLEVIRKTIASGLQYSESVNLSVPAA